MRVCVRSAALLRMPRGEAARQFLTVWLSCTSGARQRVHQFAVQRRLL
jgi:hypothetical protein